MLQEGAADLFEISARRWVSPVCSFSFLLNVTPVRIISMTLSTWRKNTRIAVEVSWTGSTIFAGPVKTLFNSFNKPSKTTIVTVCPRNSRNRCVRPLCLTLVTSGWTRTRPSKLLLLWYVKCALFHYVEMLSLSLLFGAQSVKEEYKCAWSNLYLCHEPLASRVHMLS